MIPHRPRDSAPTARPGHAAHPVARVFHLPAAKTRWTILLLLLSTTLAGCGYLPFGKKDADEAAAQVERPTIAVEVEGVKGAIARNVRAHLSLAAKPCDTAPAYLRALAARAEDEAVEAMRAYGFYASSASVAVAAVDGCPRATVTVERGPRVEVGTVDLDIRGAAHDDAGFMAALATPPIAAGQGLNHQRYADTKALIESLALGRGYLEGHFVSNVLRVDPQAERADVTLVYDSGPRYALGELRITQDPLAIDDELVRRFLEYTPGAPYHADVVTQLYSALSASEYFQSVEVRPLISAPVDHTVPVEIALTPRPQHKYTAGLGASTDEGIRGRATYSNRRLNTHGHRLNAELRASLIEQRLTTAYQVPLAHPADEWLSVQAGVRREDLDTYETIETQLGVSATKRRPWGWMETRFVNLNRQSFDISADSKTTTLIIPGLRWSKTTADDPLYPTRGYAVDFEIRGAAEQLGSDVAFARAMLSAHAVHGLPLGLRLLTRADAGASWTPDFRELPPSERFFAGGDTSIRGFQFEDLGPVDDQGEVIGGRYLAVGSVELEKLVTDTWGVAGFVDAGNAFGGDGSATGLKVGVGLGLRWRSPIGPARIDLAHPLDDDTVVRLHLRIGPDL
ncbi:MAG: outer membrane protein assembly factor [Gammaproteobacteria bacterium]|nr:outer membrane protein assembly factor [Gammaproteobacteria bacterium]